jgi:hypothetical protein
MPKGVEHWLARLGLLGEAPVEGSVMPKGVGRALFDFRSSHSQWQMGHFE